VSDAPYPEDGVYHDLYGIQEGPYSPWNFYRFTDLEEGDPGDYHRWRGYLRNNYLQPKEGVYPLFTAFNRESGEWLLWALGEAGALHTDEPQAPIQVTPEQEDPS
jgi:hypothetical protein